MYLKKRLKINAIPRKASSNTNEKVDIRNLFYSIWYKPYLGETSFSSSNIRLKIKQWATYFFSPSIRILSMQYPFNCLQIVLYIAQLSTFAIFRYILFVKYIPFILMSTGFLYVCICLFILSHSPRSSSFSSSESSDTGHIISQMFIQKANWNGRFIQRLLKIHICLQTDDTRYIILQELLGKCG